MNAISRQTLLEELEKAGIELRTGLEFEKIDSGRVVCRTGNGGAEELQADFVVLALGSVPQRKLINELREEFPFVMEAGDCIRPRKVGDAVHEGFAASWRIDNEKQLLPLLSAGNIL